MSTLFFILMLLSFIALGVLGILSVVFFVLKDKGKGKKNLKLAGISFGTLILSFILFGITDEPKDKPEIASELQVEDDEDAMLEVNAKPELTEEEKAAIAKQKEDEDKAKAEAELKKKEEAEAKAEAEKKAKEEAEAKIPREYKSALKKAETYAEVMHMSKAGIYEQLTSEYGENFPAEAAQYAIDNIVWDWKENALQKAQTYAETMNMSNAAIYEQLISQYGEQFTAEEAQYAVDNLE